MSQSKEQKAKLAAGWQRAESAFKAAPTNWTAPWEKSNEAYPAGIDVGSDYEIQDAREIDDSAYQVRPAASTNPPRPRATKVGYSRTSRTLVVKFRADAKNPDGIWWQYNDIPPEMWNDLRITDSTGKYLRHSGLDTHSDMGPLNIANLSASVQALFKG